jgi:vacuolar protein sorting-associated protein 3
VQKIVILPSSSKASALCNGTVSFYSLPELSPAFPNKEPTNVQWIGGLDDNLDVNESHESVLMIANSKRIMLVRIGDKLRSAGSNIEYPGCLRSARRDTIACVADSKGYALLEVEHLHKIPLFPISSAADEPEPPAPLNREASRSPPEGAGHGRSTSLGNLISSVADRTTSPRPLSTPDGRLLPPSHDVPTQSSELNRSPTRSSTQSPTTRQRSSTDSMPSRDKIDTKPKAPSDTLRPHIVSPFPTEFMLTTGTSLSEPGVGMFVNVDGDVVPRGTVEFPAYPEDVLVGDMVHPNPTLPSPDDDKRIIVALLRRESDGRFLSGLHIQPLPDPNAPNQAPPYWLQMKATDSRTPAGLHRVLDPQDYTFSDVAELLQAVPVRLNRDGVVTHYDKADDDPRTSSAVEQLEQEKALFDGGTGTASPPEVIAELIEKRIVEERKFVRNFGKSKSRQIVWNGQSLFSILSNPLILQLEARLNGALNRSGVQTVDAKALLKMITELRGRDPGSEVEFLTLSYIRQKTSLLLFLHLTSLFASEDQLAEHQSAIESAMHESGLDPRIVLLLIPPLASEISQGSQGIWMQQGMVDICAGFNSPIQDFQKAPLGFWMMLRHYLTLWQEKRGYGSITDEKLVFDSVDTALLHVLLYLDQALPSGSGVQVSTRTKLNNVVDNWKGSFDRPVVLLERYQRLFVLSRLYQSRKLAKDVLRTWRRIIEGEPDLDHEPNSAELEMQIKKYLAVIRDGGLVQEYGIWLAQRNPTLGVQVFAEDASRIRFDPHQVVKLLKENAPDAVQQYLEHLVFNKNLDRYADDLIGYYLDSVLDVLESSEAARESLATTYTVYRSLPSPKPTYLNFITDNAPLEAWWQSRLRLLQLLGSGGYAAADSTKELTYSVPKVLERLSPFSSYLVSESIILDARQGRHKEALKLLTHGLGDYDSAVRYCYFGGPSTAASSRTIDISELPPRDLQQELFNYLFREFLQIQDKEDCLERTSQLLGKFATWFDPLEILTAVPDDWHVGTLSEFLLRSFRAATSARNEAVIVKALSAAQNLQVQARFVEVCEKVGATIEREKGGAGAGGVEDASPEIETS